MNFKTVKRGAACLAVCAVVVATVAACSTGSDQSSEPSQSGSAASASAAVTPVNDQALGAALVKLVFQGSKTTVSDGGACLVKVVREAGISEKSLAYIVQTSGDDQGAVIDGLRKVSMDDVKILLSPELRTQMEACADTVPTSDATTPATTTPMPTYATPTPTATAPPSTAAPTPTVAPVRPTPKFEVDDQISNAAQLTKGVISMFTSFAMSEQQKQIYEAAGSCMATEIFKAGFSQDTLKFIAGGAELTSGAVIDYITDPADKALWNDPTFKQSLVDCTLSASASPTPAATTTSR